MYLYILRCANNRYYIGSTPDLERRLAEHQSGKNRATKYLLPLVLVFSQKFSSLREARQAEYWLKRQKDKKLIERVIAEKLLSKFSDLQ